MLDVALSLLVFAGCVLILACVAVLVELKRFIRDKQRQPQPTLIEKAIKSITGKVEKTTPQSVRVLQQIQEQLKHDEALFRGEFIPPKPQDN